MFFDFMMFWVDGITKIIPILLSNRVLIQPMGMSLIQRRGAPRTGAGPSDTTRDDQSDLDHVEEDLIYLTVPIPYIRDEDIPICMRRHIGSGGGRFTRLLRKVARAVACYSEHHHDD